MEAARVTDYSWRWLTAAEGGAQIFTKWLDRAGGAGLEGFSNILPSPAIMLRGRSSDSGEMRFPRIARICLVAPLLTFAACGSPRPTAQPQPGASHATVLPTSGKTVSPDDFVTPAPSGVPRETKALPPCRYVFPVEPPSAASYSAYHHDYPATDIFAPKGTTFVAPTDGVVDWVSRIDRWDPRIDDPSTRGGLSVAIIGDDGVRYYGSHLFDVMPWVEPGVRVAVGTLLGHVDSSGDARGVAPHLHFGISHPTSPSDWRVRRGELSPYTYLNAWRAGKAVTPAVQGASPASCSVVARY